MPISVQLNEKYKVNAESLEQDNLQFQFEKHLGGVSWEKYFIRYWRQS